jgi:TrmH family RNA methyltransferase
MQITSPKNPVLQDIRRAALGGRPMENGCVVLEGPVLLEEAMRGRWSVTQIFATKSAISRRPTLFTGDLAVTEVADRALASVVSTETTQGIVALVRPVEWELKDLIPGTPLILVLDGVQDPGNAGTLVRSAEAFGATGIIACSGSVRIANGKFLRATAGSIFRLPFIEDVSPATALARLQQSDVQVYALDGRAPGSIRAADLKRPCALVVGNEGGGVSGPFRNGAVRIAIPVQKVESLNAAVAGSIALFEAALQRGAA